MPHPSGEQDCIERLREYAGRLERKYGHRGLGLKAFGRDFQRATAQEPPEPTPEAPAQAGHNNPALTTLDRLKELHPMKVKAWIRDHNGTPVSGVGSHERNLAIAADLLGLRGTE